MLVDPPRYIIVSNGHSTLTIADLPFAYSTINIFYIIYTGNVDFENIFVVGLIAGMIGTFLLTIHPIQRLLNTIWYEYNVTASHGAGVESYKEHSSNFYMDVRVGRRHLRSALYTSAVRYEKDKFAGITYFGITLAIILYSLFVENFLSTVSLQSFEYLNFLRVGVFIMLAIVTYVAIKQLEDFDDRLTLSAVYFRLFEEYPTELEILNLVKNSIDLNDWASAKLLIDEIVKPHHQAIWDRNDKIK